MQRMISLFHLLSMKKKINNILLLSDCCNSTVTLQSFEDDYLRHSPIIAWYTCDRCHSYCNTRGRTQIPDDSESKEALGKSSAPFTDGIDTSTVN